MKKKLIYLFIIFLVIAGCFPPDLPERKIKREPQASEFPGKWTITSETRDRIKNFRQEYPDWEIYFPYESFILYPDSSLVIPINHKSRLFSWFIYRNYDGENIPDTIWGRWELHQNDYTDGNIASNYVIELNINMKKNISQISKLNVTEENGQLILWDFVGDPDQTIYQDYMKQ